jgi:hypothetical protein
MQRTSESRMTTALAFPLRHPFAYEYKSDSLDADDVLRQIELAEAKMKFSTGEVAAESALAKWNYERILKLLPHELQRTSRELQPSSADPRSHAHRFTPRSAPQGVADAHRHPPKACS